MYKQIMKQNPVKKNPSFDFLSLCLAGLCNKFGEGSVPYREVRAYLSRRFSFDCRTSKLLLRALAAEFPDCIKLGNRGIEIKEVAGA